MINDLESDCQNGTFLDQNEKCSFSCPGGILSGPNVLTCNDGGWMELAFGTPKCEKRSCKDLSGSIKGGAIECAYTNGDVTAGNTCKLKCNSGYKITGNESVSCKLNGGYAGNIGRCVRANNASSGSSTAGSCPNIMDVFNINAEFAVAPSCVRTKNNECSMYSFKCKDSSRNTRVSCRQNGAWSRDVSKLCL